MQTLPILLHETILFYFIHIFKLFCFHNVKYSIKRYKEHLIIFIGIRLFIYKTPIYFFITIKYARRHLQKHLLYVFTNLNAEHNENEFYNFFFNNFIYGFFLLTSLNIIRIYLFNVVKP